MTSWILPGIFSPAVGGVIADHWGFTAVFLICGLLVAGRTYIVHSRVKETPRDTAECFTLRRLLAALRNLVYVPPALRGLYWAVAVDSIAWGVGNDILFGMLRDTYKFSSFQLGVMSSLLAGVWALTQLPIGHLADRYGCKPLLILSETIGILVILGRCLSSSFGAFAILHACQGVSGAAWVPIQQALVAKDGSTGGLGGGIGKLAAARGLVAFPAPYFGGVLYERFGFRAPLAVSLVGAVVALLLLVLAVEEPHRNRLVGGTHDERIDTR
jgi:MFS family permease